MKSNQEKQLNTKTTNDVFSKKLMETIENFDKDKKIRNIDFARRVINLDDLLYYCYFDDKYLNDILTKNDGYKFDENKDDFTFITIYEIKNMYKDIVYQFDASGNLYNNILNYRNIKVEELYGPNYDYELTQTYNDEETEGIFNIMKEIENGAEEQINKQKELLESLLEN